MIAKAEIMLRIRNAVAARNAHKSFADSFRDMPGLNSVAIVARPLVVVQAARLRWARHVMKVAKNAHEMRHAKQVLSAARTDAQMGQ